MTGPVNCPVTGSYMVRCFPWWHTPAMAEIKVGYARVSTDKQDLTVQRDALAAMGVEAERIYVDHGLTGSNTNRPGLREALAACRSGDTFMVTKLDRLARSVRDAHQIADDLAARGVKLSIGQLHDAGEHTMYELAELFSVGRSTVYRALERARQKAEEKAGT